MNVNKNIILSMVISGAFAGLAGAMEALGTFQYANVKGGFTGIGFDGIAVALLGANTPLGVIFGAVLFGSLKYGALNMPNEAGIPVEIVSIVIALSFSLLHVATLFAISLKKRTRKRRRNNMSFLDVLYFIIPSAIFYAAPLIFIAIGGVFSERSGVINIGLRRFNGYGSIYRYSI